MNRTKILLGSLYIIAGVFISILIIPGCTDSSTDLTTGKGQLKIVLVDSPTEYEQVNIVVARVEVHKAGNDEGSGWVTINNKAKTYNLLTLRNGVSAVLGDNALDAGHYTQIRLVLGTGSNIVENGIEFPLDVSNETEALIKLNHEFDIQPNTMYELMLDFNAEHSIVLTGAGQYKLKPVIRIIPMSTSGTISGIVSPFINNAYVSVISGTDTIGTFAETGTGLFKLMGIVQGNYDVKVLSSNFAYNDTTVVNVNVKAKQNTDLGTIILSRR